MAEIESSIFIFEYKEWDNSSWDYCDIVFYDCTLVRNVGQFKKGGKIPKIVITYSKSVMDFYFDENDYDKYVRFNISLNIDD